jgi:murein DD-endopeptidase MepM/ murein hydrolase activator NlpD
MIGKHYELALVGLLVTLGAAFSVGCSDSGSSDSATRAAAPAAEVVDLHDDEDPSLPAPDDDPSLDAEIDADNAQADDDEEPDFADDALPSDVVTEGDIATTALALKRVSSPVPGRHVTYSFGVRNRRYTAGFHTGDDYAAPVGRRVVAVRSGKIRWSNNRGGAYGKWIGLDADNGRTYVYCHLSARLVKAGTRVTAGRTIGRVGRTGNVTGPHLHFEDHPRGRFVYARVREPRW